MSTNHPLWVQVVDSDVFRILICPVGSSSSHPTHSDPLLGPATGSFPFPCPSTDLRCFVPVSTRFDMDFDRHPEAAMKPLGWTSRPMCRRSRMRHVLPSALMPNPWAVDPWAVTGRHSAPKSRRRTHPRATGVVGEPRSV